MHPTFIVLRIKMKNGRIILSPIFPLTSFPLDKLVSFDQFPFSPIFLLAIIFDQFSSTCVPVFLRPVFPHPKRLNLSDIRSHLRLKFLERTLAPNRAHLVLHLSMESTVTAFCSVCSMRITKRKRIEETVDEVVKRICADIQ